MRRRFAICPAPGWKMVRPVTAKIEKMPDGGWIASWWDSWGEGKSVTEAIEDLAVSMFEEYRILNKERVGPGLLKQRDRLTGIFKRL